VDLGGTVLASVPVNSEAGSYLTFAIPVGLFCVIGAILYVLLFSRPHARVPARRVSAPAHAGPPGPDASGAAAVASGLPTAAGGGSAESGVVPGGAVSAAITTTGSVAGEPAEAGDAGHGTAEGTATSEGTTGGTTPTEGTEASE
jgi:hypothetical protein